MKSLALPSFWSGFRQLPPDVQTSARQVKRFESGPGHPGLRFKLIKGDVWSVRVGMGYRALGHRNGDEITWYWIGTRQDYRQAIKAI